MKKLYDVSKTSEKIFKKLVDGEASKHSAKHRRKHTLKKSQDDFTKKIAENLASKVFKKSKSVLCIGCRDESELTLFERLGLHAEGIDPAIKTQKIKQAPAEKINEHFIENEFDFVYASHSLEHVIIPEKVMSSIRRVSRSGCYVILPAIKRDTPKVGHPILYDICKHSPQSSKESLTKSIKEDFKMFEPYNIEDIFFKKSFEPEFHICFTWREN